MRAKGIILVCFASMVSFVAGRVDGYKDGKTSRISWEANFREVNKLEWQYQEKDWSETEPIDPFLYPRAETAVPRCQEL